jgi:hypothetical protein
MKNALFTCLLIALTMIGYSQNPDEATIRAVIEGETQAYHAGNVDKMLEFCEVNADYAERQQIYFKQPLGTVYLKGEKLRQFTEVFKQSHKATGFSFKTLDYEAHISGNMAWATYTQETFKADGTLVNRTRELRILEKKDKWKIVLISQQEF